MTCSLSLWCNLCTLLVIEAAKREDSLLYPYTIEKDPDLLLHTGIESWSNYEVEDLGMQKVVDDQFVHQVKGRDADSDSLLDDGSGIITTEPSSISCISLGGELFCESDTIFQYQWPQTLSGSVQHGQCFGNTTSATRTCQQTCVWSEVNCSVSDQLFCILQNLISGHAAETVIQDLQNITANFTRKPEPLSEVYLLSQILYQAEISRREFSLLFQQQFLETSSNLLNQQYRDQSISVISKSERYQAGTLLLQTLDSFGLIGVTMMSERSSFRIETENIVWEVCNNSLTCGHSVREKNKAATVQLNHFNYAKALIFSYTNLTGLLPDGRTDMLCDLRLATSVVTVGRACENDTCGSSVNENLSISIMFLHSPITENVLSQNPTFSTVCVYWGITERVPPPDNPFGFWSSEGNCIKNGDLSNAIQTVCECSSTGTFAAVLNEQSKILTWIYAFGASFSLLALIITVVTLIVIRALWGMPTAVHINLCVTSALVILSFAVRGSPSNNTLLCTILAVLKHYFLTVQLMWVLIDGTVLLLLYLVSKFKHKLRFYILGFIILAYGLPILYLCISLPSGFLIWNEMTQGYGDSTGCFLRFETRFYFFFIAPVAAVVIIATILFGAVVVAKHSQRSRDLVSKRRFPTSSLVVHVLLLVYFTLTWLVIPFTNNIYIVYLSTVLVSIQGLFIFILYVPFSKIARESIGDCLSNGWVRFKHIFVLWNLKDTSQERPSSFVFVLEPANDDDVQSNPVALDKEKGVERSLETKSATNPSDVSLWRIATLHREVKLQPTIEEIEEKATVVTFL